MAKAQSRVSGLVERAGRHLRASLFLTRLTWWLSVSLGWWLLLFVLDNLLRLPAGLRFPLAVGGAAILCAAVSVFRRARRRPAEAVAVVLERRFAIPDNVLINALQFERSPVRDEERPFAMRTAQACRALLPGIRPTRLWDRRRLGRWGAGSAVLIALWIVYLSFFPRYAVNAASRYVRPMADQPPVGRVSLTVVPASDVVIPEGEDLQVRAVVAEAAGAGGRAAVPTVSWREGRRRLEPSAADAEQAPMVAADGGEGTYVYTFPGVRRAFSFRIFAADTYSAGVRVSVRPRPRLKESWVELTPPPYTGAAKGKAAGPPAPLSGLSGTRARVVVSIDPPVESAWWVQGGTRTPLAAGPGAWSCDTVITAAAPYEIVVKERDILKELSIARGDVLVETDRPPQVDFTTTDRNRLVTLGSSVRLDLEARDDFGLRSVRVTVRTADHETGDGETLRAWTYLGPPGPKGPSREGFDLTVDAGRFDPGRVYLVEAVAADFCPEGRTGKSRPVVLRVKSPADYELPAGDPLGPAFERLRRTIGAQQKSLGMTANLALHLDEATARKSVGDHRRAIAQAQDDARRYGTESLALFRKGKEDGQRYAARLAPLVEGEMPWVLGDLGKLAGDQPDALPGRVKSVEDRQAHILGELLALLGRLADDRRQEANTAAETAGVRDQLPVTGDTLGADLNDALKDFQREQEKILNQSKTLADRGPEDLTDDEEKILGQLAREESKWASLFEEKLTDFSKLPNQDFADGSLAEEVNEVYQDIQKASAELYAKNVDLAVPQEQAGLEAAEELQHNLEKWLSDVPDNLKWEMEEPPAPTDIPMAELPAELEDIVGELLDQEEAMTEDVEDVTSSWMDSLDKGAGWTAMDGPISDMSAKGITGNLLPNQQEIGGRSGEGRTGRSHGQMVEETAEGKDGRQTPTRLTPSPFEPGSVEDSSKGDPGGATGGGKLSGYSEQGLRGPTPPPAMQDMPRLAQQQAKIRQEAEALALKLRAYKMPSGDVETSARQMAALEAAAQRRDGLRVRQAYSKALDALRDAGRALRTEKGLQRERNRLPDWIRGEILAGYREGLPKGYEEIVAAYFRSLAEGEGGLASAPPPPEARPPGP